MQIPAFSNIITVAWAIGANVYVKELDKTFLESLNRIKSVMKRWYPELPFSTEIHVGNIVSNELSDQGQGLLFSGGIDSTTSYIRHKKANLIMVWGVDIPLAEVEFWRKVKNRYKDLAEITFIKSNLREFISKKLHRQFYLSLKAGWWESFQHGIGLLGLCAQVTVAKHIGTLLIASSVTPELGHPWGSIGDNELSWADVRVVQNGYMLSRQQKIKNVLGRYIRNHRYYPFLRVCYSQFRKFNCGKCDKCLRTITGLVLENIDPNRCGFKIDSNFFRLLKQKFVRYELQLDEVAIFLWKDIQRHIPKTISHNLYNSKEFFGWFRHYDVSKNAERKASFAWCLYRIYHKLPKDIQRVITTSLPE